MYVREGWNGLPKLLIAKAPTLPLRSERAVTARPFRLPFLRKGHATI